jgi:hypothetical protein
MNRRNFLYTSVASSLGVSFLHAADPKVASAKTRAKSVIYLFMAGGFPQYDSFNVKDVNKEVLGKSTILKSNVSDMPVTNFYPKMAKKMDKMTLINSMTSNQGAHPPAIYKMLTSFNPRSSIVHPELGSWVSKTLSKDDDAIPNYVCINGSSEGSAGFFPGRYAALPVLDPKSGIEFIQRHKKVDEASFDKRLSMLNAMNNEYEKTFGNRETLAYSDTYNNAVKFMASPDRVAFDVSKENPSITKLYAKDKFSMGCMLAARLVERGVKFCRVNLNGWDYHDGIYDKMPSNAAALDSGLSALLEHLEQKGLLQDTLVVVASEFGRSANINQNVGRDHQPKAFTCMLAGAGLAGGRTYGKVTSDGKDVAENPIQIEDFNATIAWAVGLDTSREEISPQGRPFKVADKGKPLTNLF